MKNYPSKEIDREALNKAIDTYLSNGGQIQKLPDIVAQNPLLWDKTSDLYIESEPLNGVRKGLTIEERSEDGFNYSRSAVQERIRRRGNLPERKYRGFRQGSYLL